MSNGGAKALTHCDLCLLYEIPALRGQDIYTRTHWIPLRWIRKFGRHRAG
jgi:hypothetical protein